MFSCDGSDAFNNKFLQKACKYQGCVIELTNKQNYKQQNTRSAKETNKKCIFTGGKKHGCHCSNGRSTWVVQQLSKLTNNLPTPGKNFGRSKTLPSPSIQYMEVLTAVEINY